MTSIFKCSVCDSSMIVDEKACVNCESCGVNLGYCDVGTIYVMGNDSMPSLYKIGRTDRSAEERRGELSSGTAVPLEFKIILTYYVENSFEVEAEIHSCLSKYRVSEYREFFRWENCISEIHKEIIKILSDRLLLWNCPNKELQEKIFYKNILLRRQPANTLCHVPGDPWRWAEPKK